MKDVCFGAKPERTAGKSRVCWLGYSYFSLFVTLSRLNYNIYSLYCVQNSNKKEFHGREVLAPYPGREKAQHRGSQEAPVPCTA